MTSASSWEDMSAPPLLLRLTCLALSVDVR
jgi:hypothetical protein